MSTLTAGEEAGSGPGASSLTPAKLGRCGAPRQLGTSGALLGRNPEERLFMSGPLPDGRCRQAYRNGERIDTAGPDWRAAWAHVARLRAA
jgi:hypothetical protein